MQRIGTQQECLTLLSLYIRLTTGANHYLNTRLSNGKELGNEYIATDAEAINEESIAQFISRLMC